MFSQYGLQKFISPLKMFMKNVPIADWKDTEKYMIRTESLLSVYSKQEEKYSCKEEKRNLLSVS